MPHFPIKVYDEYPCQGTDAKGKPVFFHDLVKVGDRIGEPVPGDPLNAFPPFGRVVERDDGLWVEAEEGQ